MRYARDNNNMCGIISIKGNTDKISSAQVESMLSCLGRRGPDAKKFLRLASCILGQTRLSIVDVATGDQPMRDNMLPITIVFNGEIYGYKDTRADLEKKGHIFSTASDTEVILKSYIEYGVGCLEHLDGMFAFALYDERSKELFVARDRFGKKPLYYAWLGNTFIAASEIKSLFASGMIKGTISMASIADYLHLMYIPAHKTPYTNIHSLPPAHAGIVKNSSISVWKYWELKKNESSIGFEDAKEEFRRLFEKSVEKRMVADVEIGSLLSGGVDSTYTTLIAQRYSPKPLKTFSVGYKDGFDESEYALTVSKKIGTDHYSHRIQDLNISGLEMVAQYFDVPHADTSNVPQYEISSLASSKVKVALSGDGADELFMGYGWYQKYWHTPRWKWERIFLNPYTMYKRVTGIFDEQEICALTDISYTTDDEYIGNTIKTLPDPFWKINANDLLYYLPGQLLSKVDYTSMMNSLEIRCPFLDTALAEFVYNLPTSFKLGKKENKILLKEILAEYMPEDFVYRKKRGFGAPIKEWLMKPEMRNYLETKLGGQAHIRDMLKSGHNIDTLIDGFYNKNKPWQYKLWTLLCLELWLEFHHPVHAN
jgi:asparagine synthase (glutamine-hydrolysing)